MYNKDKDKNGKWYSEVSNCFPYNNKRSYCSPASVASSHNFVLLLFVFPFCEVVSIEMPEFGADINRRRMDKVKGRNGGAHSLTWPSWLKHVSDSKGILFSFSMSPQQSWLSDWDVQRSGHTLLGNQIEAWLSNFHSWPQLFRNMLLAIWVTNFVSWNPIQIRIRTWPVNFSALLICAHLILNTSQHRV